MRLPVWVLSVVLVLVVAVRALAGEPRGPEIGTNRYVAAIDSVAGAADVDDYVGVLAAGETLRVRVSAAAKGALRPVVRIVDPEGAETTPPASVKKGGRLVVVEPIVVAKTGRWIVRIAGDARTEGPYEVKFEIGPAPRPKAVTRHLGGTSPLAATHTIVAVHGARLSVTLASIGPGAPAALRSITGPTGEPVPIPPETVTTSGDRTVLRDVPLAAGSGSYSVHVAIDGGEAVYALKLGLAPPPRPRGTIPLEAKEPYLVPRAEPLDGTPGSAVQLAGAHFAAGTPRPRVWFGDLEASVASASPTGSMLHVVVPNGADGNVVDVTVQNPDGQAVTRPGWFRYVSEVPLDVVSIEPSAAVLQVGATRRFTVTTNRRAPPLGAVVVLTATGAIGAVPTSVTVPPGESRAGFDVVAPLVPAAGRITASFASSVAADVTVVPPAALASLTPSPVVLLEGATQRFTIALEAPAPPPGLDVVLSATGSIGTMPGWVHVPGGATSVQFDFTAADVRAEGSIRAAASNTIAAEVVVRPPSSIDLSGWRVEQANSARSFTIPDGTILAEGGLLVIARNSPRGEFETFWGRTLAPGVVYVNSGDAMPSINGSETFLVRDAGGALVDGPTVAMPAAAGAVLLRTAGMAAGSPASWTILPATPASSASPGAVPGPAAAPAGVYVSEFADASGSGSYVHEFVEIAFDRLP